MKKLKNIIILLCVCLCSLFVACDNGGRHVNTPAIDMSRYFMSTVKSYHKASAGEYYTEDNFALKSFVGEKPNASTMYMHTYVQFSGDTPWMTGMYIECVYFYVVADADINEEQLSFVMYGLDGGIYDTEASKYKVEQNSIGISGKANVGRLVRVDINHKATSDGLMIEIHFNPSVVGYKWTIYGLSVYGETRK